MNSRIRVLMLGFGIASVLTFAATANASISGVVFCGVSGSVAGNTPTTATLAAAEATGTQCASFSATSIDFSAEGKGSYSLGGFLTGYGAANGITYMPGFSGSSALDNSLFVFTGTASFTNGAGFTVTHDDGTIMYVNGNVVLNVPGPTGPVSTPFTYGGPTGNFGFQFIYTECCGGAADYITTLVPPVSPSVPEPGTLVLLGSGLLGLGGVIRRRLML